MSKPTTPIPFARPGAPAVGCDQAPELQLNLNVRGLTPSATVAINELSDRLVAGGRRIFKLGLGQSPFPVPDAVVEALRQNATQKDYLPVLGLPELREAVAGHHRRSFNIETTADNVMIGPGSKELMFILQLVYYGDLVIPTPSWVSYAPQARIIGRQIRALPTRPEDGWRICPQQLDELCRADPTRPRVLVLNYPSNPTGTTYSVDELSELAEVAQRYRLIVLSDEIYGKLHHQGEHRSIAPIYPQGTVFSGGLSKWCGAGGWRLGLFIFPRCLSWLRDAMAAVASETFTSTSAPIQYAAVEAFTDDSRFDDYLVGVRRVLRALGRHVAGQLRAAGADVVTPDGGFYLFPDFAAKSDRLRLRGIHTSVDLCARLLEETGVAILPGSEFGRPVTELTARLAYVNFDGAAALRAVARLEPGEPIDERFLRRHCGEVLEAAERIRDWLNA
jgi:aspartate aminotransferase